MSHDASSGFLSPLDPMLGDRLIRVHHIHRLYPKVSIGIGEEKHRDLKQTRSQRTTLTEFEQVGNSTTDHR